MGKAKHNILKMKRFWLSLFLISSLASLVSCAGPRALMQTAPSIPKGAPAKPSLTLTTQHNWQSDKSSIRAALETHIYGKSPPLSPARLNSQSLAPIAAFDDIASVEEILVHVSPNNIDSAPLPVVLVMPNKADGPVPLILMQNFCPNHLVIPVAQLSTPKDPYFNCSNEGILSGIFTYFFGRHIVSPPVKDILTRGYGLAVIHPPQFIPDSEKISRNSLAGYDAPHWGAIGAWAWQAGAIAEYLQNDSRFSDIISYGHSRYGKSALLAAALSPAIDGVISHQSGTGGASLSRNKKGESVAAIIKGYPHWFTPRYANHGEDQGDLPIDQHHLLALIAPRPVLLGNARRDVWSDPEGAFRAARGASPAYQLYKQRGLGAQKLTEYIPQDTLAFWMRPGTHGVTAADWDAFLEFLDAHFK